MTQPSTAPTEHDAQRAPGAATRRLRYAVLGAGNRCQMYLDAMVGAHAEVAEAVAVGDTNRGRADFFRRWVADRSGGAEPGYLDPADLAGEIDRLGLDKVVITTPDYTHADLICTALRAGADVVVEKPLTIDAEGCRRIAEAAEETGREVVVTFNYRYSPRNSALKQVILDGRIGTPLSVDFSWVLDTVHGADYFRRWHRRKEFSGGLLVHKATHHFDLVNWWLADVPARVYASGGLRFYGADAARARGRDTGPERGTDDAAQEDPFALDLRTDERLKALYLDQEHLDGYRRDQGVFTEGIDIEDNLAVIVDYARGATLNYSLNAHSPWEGYRVAVNGTEGRAELEVVERAAVRPASGGSPVDPSVSVDDQASLLRRRGERLLVQRHWEAAEEVPIVNGEGSHGGGDKILLSDIFRGAGEDPLARPARLADGIASVAVGVAGNASLAAGMPVRVGELALPGLGEATVATGAVVDR
ncbi:Gfo/Idh/MocA family protein [Ornithinicoccus halotolerans]|uniref:Gfo/Idh/MocA family protein n=1 Tax=Ornithinicoccus halotolerans TaxID=1748220 RepID=UPI0012974B98|nr:Gfo/Idh/MocA family oxidoreductase [Ornithinicoccus halotolerans]